MQQVKENCIEAWCFKWKGKNKGKHMKKSKFRDQIYGEFTPTGAIQPLAHLHNYLYFPML